MTLPCLRCLRYPALELGKL